MEVEAEVGEVEVGDEEGEEDGEACERREEEVEEMDDG